MDGLATDPESDLRADPRLADICTRDIQWELERREGVTSLRVGPEATVKILVDEKFYLMRRGPLTVSVNQD